jgi:4-diphosphocytidyl-2-C-methyl-D-erythritol kinase
VPAKVNLHLAVGDRRADGYHELTTVFQALSLTDEVVVAAAEDAGVEVVGDGAASVPSGTDNLAWRAVEVLAEHVGRDLADAQVQVLIRKTIPVAGGMAGGSADAAATLVGLAALWKLTSAGTSWPVWPRAWAVTCRSCCTVAPPWVPAGASGWCPSSPGTRFTG